MTKTKLTLALTVGGNYIPLGSDVGVGIGMGIGGGGD
jgi:hypothetical protein